MKGVTEDFVSAFENVSEDDLKKPFFRLLASGIIPNGVDEFDPGVVKIINRALIANGIGYMNTKLFVDAMRDTNIDAATAKMLVHTLPCGVDPDDNEVKEMLKKARKILETEN